MGNYFGSLVTDQRMKRLKRTFRNEARFFDFQDCQVLETVSVGNQLYVTLAFTPFHSPLSILTTFARVESLFDSDDRCRRTAQFLQRPDFADNYFVRFQLLRKSPFGESLINLQVKEKNKPSSSSSAGRKNSTFVQTCCCNICEMLPKKSSAATRHDIAQLEAAVAAGTTPSSDIIKPWTDIALATFAQTQFSSPSQPVALPPLPEFKQSGPEEQQHRQANEEEEEEGEGCDTGTKNPQEEEVVQPSRDQQEEYGEKHRQSDDKQDWTVVQANL